MPRITATFDLRLTGTVTFDVILWLLATGFWNDNGVWDDASTWID